MTITDTIAPPTLFGQMHNDVEEFSIAFGETISDVPTYPSHKLQTARVSFMTEEYGEFMEAFDSDDLQEVADALVDMPYFGLGTALAYGVALPGGRDYLEWDLIGAPKLRHGFGMRQAIKLAMEDAFREYLAAEEDGSDLPWIAAAIQKLINTCLDIAYILDIPYREVWDEIHGSNMAKMIDGEVIRHPETGKVLKPESWEPPSVGRVLREAGWK